MLLSKTFFIFTFRSLLFISIGVTLQETLCFSKFHRDFPAKFIYSIEGFPIFYSTFSYSFLDLHPLASVHRFAGFHELERNLCEPILKITTKRYSRTNSWFATCQMNYVTINEMTQEKNTLKF